MIPRSHPLASVREAFNAVFVESEAAGQLMFYGPGAGGAPTASAVLGDLVTVASNRLGDVRGVGESAYAERPVLPMGQTIPATTSRSTSTTRRECSRQWPWCSPSTTCRSRPSARTGRGEDAQLVVVSHRASDAALSATVENVRKMDSCTT